MTDHVQTVFERLFEYSPDAIAVVDDAGRIRRVNAQAVAMFGYGRDELLGEPVEKLLPVDLRSRHRAHRARFSAEPGVRPMGAGLELLGRRKDGSEFPVDIMLSPVDTEDGRMVLGVVRDVTEPRRIDRELREKNVELEKALHTKDRFLAGMSHELRTPLNAIIGFTGTLLMKLPGPLTADQDKQLRTIQASARHLLTLINDLLDLVKIESGSVELNLEPVACCELLQDAAAELQPLAQAKGLSFEVKLPPRPVHARTDRRSLLQILLNLGSNAIKFTDRGSVVMSLRERTDAGRAVTELSVADTGPGIPAEALAGLFKAFAQLDPTSTRRYEGTGLGLYLSRKLAELLGARIDVASEPGRGSVFTITLGGK